MKSLHTQTIEELGSSLSEGASSSVELVEQLFDVIEQDAGRVGAYISLNREQIHREALQADEQRAQHGSNSLLGIPISIKDLINVKGNPCTCSSEILKGYIHSHLAEELLLDYLQIQNFSQKIDCYNLSTMGEGFVK